MPIKQNLNQTTEDRIQLGLSGGLLKQVNTDQIELRDATDTVYVRGYAFTPLGGDPANTIATKGYVDTAVAGAQMQGGQVTMTSAVGAASVSSTFAVAPPLTSMVSRVKCKVSGGGFTAGTITVTDAAANPLATFTGQLAADGDYAIELGPQKVTLAGQFIYSRAGLAGPGTAVVFVEYTPIPDAVSLP